MGNQKNSEEEDLWKRITQTQGEEKVEALVSLSYLARNRGDHGQCLVLCEAARDIYEELGTEASNATLANIYNGIGWSLRNLDRPAEAAKVVERTIDLYRAIGSAETIVALRNEASALYDAGLFEKSLEYHLQVLAEPNPNGDKFELARDHYNWAMALAKLTRWSEALEALVTARKIFKDDRSPIGVACCDEEISRCHYKLSDGINAQHFAQLAMDFAVTSRDDDRLCWANARMGFAKKILGEFEVARSYFEAAIALILATGNPDWRYVVQLERQIAEILFAGDQKVEAGEILRRLRTIEDTVGVDN